MSNPLEFKIRGNMNGIKYPALAEVKYDGICVTVDASTRIATTKEGRIYKLPALGINLKQMQNGPPSIFLAEWILKDGFNGELYSLLKNKKNNTGTIRIFDVLMWDNVDVSKSSLPLIYRKMLLVNFIKPEFLADSIVVDNKEQLECFESDVLKGGYEGIVVKNLNEPFRAQTWVKIKHEDHVALIVKQVDSARISVDHGGILVGVARPTVVDIDVGDEVEIKHNGIQPSGSLRNPVFVRILNNGVTI
jgi:hypothetical protein